MDSTELIALLDRLRREPRETEWLEFKTSHFVPQVLGEYLSALANAAALVGKPLGKKPDSRRNNQRKSKKNKGPNLVVRRNIILKRDLRFDSSWRSRHDNHRLWWPPEHRRQPTAPTMGNRPGHLNVEKPKKTKEN